MARRVNRVKYTEDKKLLRKNLQGFLNAVIRHFGPAVVSDRAGIEKNIGSQLRMHVCFKHAFADSNCPDTVRDRLCKQYQFVVHRWEEAYRQI